MQRGEGRVATASAPGKLTQEDWPRLTAACDKLMKAPIYVDDTGSITMMELRSKARRLKAREPGLGLIIVDYLQLMTSGGTVENRVQEVSQISRNLKVLARDLDVPILALSQLSRAVEQRHDKRPILSDLRESGSIEQDADLVLFVYRDEYYNGEESDQQGLAEVILAKHRNGPTDAIKLSFLKRYAKFADLAGGLEPLTRHGRRAPCEQASRTLDPAPSGSRPDSGSASSSAANDCADRRSAIACARGRVIRPGRDDDHRETARRSDTARLPPARPRRRRRHSRTAAAALLRGRSRSLRGLRLRGDAR